MNNNLITDQIEFILSELITIGHVEISRYELMHLEKLMNSKDLVYTIVPSIGNMWIVTMTESDRLIYKKLLSSKD